MNKIFYCLFCIFFQFELVNADILNEKNENGSLKWASEWYNEYVKPLDINCKKELMLIINLRQQLLQQTKVTALIMEKKLKELWTIKRGVSKSNIEKFSSLIESKISPIMINLNEITKKSSEKSKLALSKLEEIIAKKQDEKNQTNPISPNDSAFLKTTVLQISEIGLSAYDACLKSFNQDS